MPKKKKEELVIAPMPNKYHFVCVGGEAPISLMKRLLGLVEASDTDPENVVIAYCLQDAVQVFEGTQELSEYVKRDQDDPTNGRVAMLWTGGHVGYLVIREDMFGKLKAA